MPLTLPMGYALKNSHANYTGVRTRKKSWGLAYTLLPVSQAARAPSLAAIIGRKSESDLVFHDRVANHTYADVRRQG